MFRKTYGPRIGIVSACLIFILSSPAPYILSLGVLIKFIFNLDLAWGLLLQQDLVLHMYGTVDYQQ